MCRTRSTKGVRAPCVILLLVTPARRGASRLQGKYETMKKALITGVTGQDGAYLAEFLLGKGYEVHGITRRTSSFNTARVDHLYHDPHVGGMPFELHYGDMTDATNLIRPVRAINPD